MIHGHNVTDRTTNGLLRQRVIMFIVRNRPSKNENVIIYSLSRCSKLTFLYPWNTKGELQNVKAALFQAFNLRKGCKSKLLGELFFKGTVIFITLMLFQTLIIVFILRNTKEDILNVSAVFVHLMKVKWLWLHGKKLILSKYLLLYSPECSF